MTRPTRARLRPPLHVLKTVFESVHATLARLAQLKPVVLVVAPLLFITLAALNWVTWPLEKDSEASFLLIVVLMLPHLLVASMVAALAAVPWHRLMLRGEPVTMAATLRLDRRMLRYGAAVFALGGLYTAVLVLPVWTAFEVALPMLGTTDAATEAPPAETEEAGSYPGEAALSVAAGLLLGLPLLLAAGLVPARLALVLPAIAVGDPTMSFGRSWQLTRGNSWRLVLGAALAMLPGLWGYVAAFWLSEDRLWGSLGAAAIEVVWLVAGIVLVTYLSLVYRHFTGGGD